jgi:histidinol-phosphatase
VTPLATFRETAHELADLADAATMRAFRRHLDVRTKADGPGSPRSTSRWNASCAPPSTTASPTTPSSARRMVWTGRSTPPRWVLDPIDGTTNFVKGNPVFATLIGLQVDGRDVIGVASAPALGTRFDGIAGGPARQDGRPIHVSEIDRLAAAEVAFGGLSHFRDRQLDTAPELLTRASARQRGYGDFWNHCLVAAGSTDVAVEAEVSLWDLVAVKVIVEAAGGRFTDLDGVATADGGSALSTNGRLHEQVLAVLAQASGESDA